MASPQGEGLRSAYAGSLQLLFLEKNACGLRYDTRPFLIIYIL